MAPRKRRHARSRSSQGVLSPEWTKMGERRARRHRASSCVVAEHRSGEEDAGVPATRKETGERQLHRRKQGSTGRRRPAMWFGRRRPARWFCGRRPARWFERRRWTVGDHRRQFFVVHEAVRRHGRQRRTIGEDEQVLRKKFGNASLQFQTSAPGTSKIFS
jgi:hypothetical protein